MLEVISLIIDQTSNFIDKDDLVKMNVICAMVELCHFAVSFLLQFVTEGLNYINPFDQLENEESQKTVSFLPIKRIRNTRECERLPNNKDMMSTEKNGFDVEI